MVCQLIVTAFRKLISPNHQSKKMSVMLHQLENLDNEKGLSKNVSMYRLDNSMCECCMVSHVVGSLTLHDKLDLVCV